MPLLLDTFNVLHTTGVLPPDLAGLDVPGLARLTLRSRYASEKVLFCCDGLPASDLPPAGPLELQDHPDAAVEVRYSGKASTADELIGRMIDASTAPRRLTVASSDHAIQRHARKRRCTVLTSEEFLQQLADDSNLPRTGSRAAHRPPMMSAEQVEAWRRAFDVDESALRSQFESKPPKPSPARQVEASPVPVDQVEGAAPSPTRPGPLPHDVISEAERIPNASAAPASPPRPAEANDEFDMTSILPDDGRTHPLRKRGERHRP